MTSNTFAVGAAPAEGAMLRLQRMAMVSLCAAVLAACGGGGDTGEVQGSTTATTPTVVSDPSGLGPNSAGKYADARGFYPDAAGRYPDENGIYPDSNGNYLSASDAGIFKNASGFARSYSTLGPIDTTNVFFQPLGNGRSCASCHVRAEGFTITPAGLKERFDKTDGLDPIFSLNDGANAPNLPVSTLAERTSAYSLLLSKGLIRIGIPMPTQTNDAVPKPVEFELIAINDPYNYATANELSLYRRPLPAANLKFLSTVMWDGRETIFDSLAAPTVPTNCTKAGTLVCLGSFEQALKNQANGATTGHAQFAAGLTDAQKKAVVDFELSLFTAQEYDNDARFLSSAKAKGGGNALFNQVYYFDINSVFNDPQTGLAGTVTKLTAMDLFAPWEANAGSANAGVAAARASIVRGQKIFNSRTFTMVGVAGTRFTTQTAATCTNCHSAQNVGSLSVPTLFGLGVGEPAWGTLPDLPIYTFRRISNGQTKVMQDPGAALITGKWADLGKFKTPSLRGLAMRPPYFHDGSAKTIEETTDFYLKRFVYDVPMTTQDINDLNAFLKSL